MIKNFSHVGLSVSNMQRSLEFYRDFLGMTVLMELDIQDNRIGRVIGFSEAKCKIMHLQLGATILELFEFTEPLGENIAKNMCPRNHGISHIGFEVNNIHRHLQDLQERGVEMLGELVEFRPGVLVAYFRGLDGEILEFRQQPE